MAFEGKLKPSHELQLIDTNCNDCKFMVRDFDRNNKRKQERINTGRGDSFVYGHCTKKNNQEVFFSPNTCTPENADCFKHRKD